MNRLLWLMVLTLALPLAGHAAAPSIHVGAMYEYLSPGQASLLKRVHNRGTATAFVRVSIREVVYDQNLVAHEHEVDTAEEGGGGLIASPGRLIIPAQGQQAARLVFMGDRSRERYYRVRFVPVLPKAADEFALTTEEARDYDAQLSAGVNVLAGYGVFLIVHPDGAHPDVRIEQHPGHVLLHNVGNSTAVLDDVRTCTVAGRTESCAPSQRIHLLPQRQHRLDQDQGQRHRLQLVEGERRRSLQLVP